MVKLQYNVLTASRSLKIKMLLLMLVITMATSVLEMGPGPGLCWNHHYHTHLNPKSTDFKVCRERMLACWSGVGMNMPQAVTQPCTHAIL